MRLTGSQKNKLLLSFKLGITGALLSTIILILINQKEILIESALVSFVIGFLIGVFENFISQPKLRKLRFQVVVLIRTSVYAVIIVFSALLLTLIKLSVVNQCSVLEAITDQGVVDYITYNNLHIILLFLIVLSFLVNLILQINQLLGPGVLLKYFLGKYHQPRLEERIFLFLDLNSSTTIAEKLGAEKYSAFLKQFFSDLTEPLLETQGQVFQYCGDEVIVFWNVEDGISNNNALNFIFSVEKVIRHNKEKYLSRFGLIPKFKAGLHYGETLITEVGDLKKEIVYHGDLVNTASRIRSACGTLNKKVLLSKNLLEKLDINNKYLAEDMGDIKLKGKENITRLYSIEPV